MADKKKLGNKVAKICITEIPGTILPGAGTYPAETFNHCFNHFRKLDLNPHQNGKLDPDPHQSEKLDPDPNRSEKQDPDPYQSEKVEALEAILKQ
jgi:hypothetical protein